MLISVAILAQAERVVRLWRMRTTSKWPEVARFTRLIVAVMTMAEVQSLSVTRSVRSAYAGQSWSALTMAQQKRRLRDSYFKAYHSKPGQAFVEVDWEDRKHVKAMAKGRQLQRELNLTSCSSARSPSAAAHQAHQKGCSSAEEYQKNKVVAKKSNRGRHADSRELALAHPPRAERLTSLSLS